MLEGIGSNRLLRAAVANLWHSGQTVTDVHLGGPPGAFLGGLKLINRLWIARETDQVREASVGLRLRILYCSLGCPLPVVIKFRKLS
jgi:hypothetical protein